MDLVTAPGVGASATVTLRKNGVNTALTCTISGTATSCSDTTNSVTYADGDVLAVIYNEAGGPANSRIKFNIRYVSPP